MAYGLTYNMLPLYIVHLQNLSDSWLFAHQTNILLSTSICHSDLSLNPTNYLVDKVRNLKLDPEWPRVWSIGG